MSTTIRMFGALCAVLLVVGIAVSQDRPAQQSDPLPPPTPQHFTMTTPGQMTQEGQMGQAGQTSEMDKYLAQWLIGKNRCEMELARLGQQQSENPQVREFAARMIQEHQQVIQQLESIAGHSGHNMPSQMSGQESPSQTESRTMGQMSDTTPQGTMPSETAPMQPTPTSPTQQPGSQHMAAGGDAAQQLIQVMNQAGMKTVEAWKQVLQRGQGQQFDRTFMALQVLGHIAMRETLDVAQAQASGQLQRILAQTRQSVDQHLTLAQNIEQQLGSSQGPARAARQEGETRR